MFRTCIAVPALMLCARLALGAQISESARFDARQTLDARIAVIEHQVVPAAEAMPAEKYSYAPAGAGFTGVRTFAGLVKHLAASNWQLASRVLATDPPAGTANEEAPPRVRTKGEILDYLRGSFEALHRAAATVTEGNLVEPFNSGMTEPWGRTRLGLIIDAIAHSSDTYGQIVEYLRGNGVVPPASR